MEDAKTATRFGGSSSLIWDTGAGRNICAHRHLPNYKLEHTDHPGFNGPSGETIKVKGNTRVAFSDDVLKTNAEATFIVADTVTRPILSGGDVNDQGNITISSAQMCIRGRRSRRASSVRGPHAARQACVLQIWSWEVL